VSGGGNGGGGNAGAGNNGCPTTTTSTTTDGFTARLSEIVAAAEAAGAVRCQECCYFMYLFSVCVCLIYIFVLFFVSRKEVRFFLILTHPDLSLSLSQNPH
jgi:hypothetical protein